MVFVLVLLSNSYHHLWQGGWGQVPAPCKLWAEIASYDNHNLPVLVLGVVVLLVLCVTPVAILVQALLHHHLLVGGLCFRERATNRSPTLSVHAASRCRTSYFLFTFVSAAMSDFITNPAADEEMLGAMEAAGAVAGAPPLFAPGKGKGQLDERVEELLDEAAATLKGKGGAKGVGLAPGEVHPVLDPGAPGTPPFTRPLIFASGGPEPALPKAASTTTPGPTTTSSATAPLTTRAGQPRTEVREPAPVAGPGGSGTTPSARPPFAPPIEVARQIEGDFGGALSAVMSYSRIPHHLGMGFMEAGEFSDSDHFTLVGALDSNDLQAIFTSMLKKGTISVADRSRIKMLVLTCRYLSGFPDITPESLSPPAAPAPSTSSSSTVVASDGKKINAPDTIALSETIDQTAKGEVKLLDRPTLQAARKRFRQKTGEDPTEEEDVSAEQLSAFNAVMQELFSIYADFAIWVPFWGRLAKRLRFTGTIIDHEGNFRLVELLGPPGYDEWEACYIIFRTACLMFGVIEPAVLDRYMKVIRGHARRYPKCWALIYQADVRMRSERAMRIRDELEYQHEIAVENNWPTHFNPKQPWNAVWKQMASAEEKWWWRNVERPGIMIQAHVAKMEAYVGQDAPISGHKRIAPLPTTDENDGMAAHQLSTAKRNKTLQITNYPYVPAMAEQGPVGGGAPTTTTQEYMDLSQHNGHCYTLTRQGLAPCQGYNAGTCTRTGRGNRCGVNQDEVHQCNLCLRTGHGASTCFLNKKGGKGSGKGADTQKSYKGKGAGKNKGKGKGAKPWTKKAQPWNEW